MSVDKQIFRLVPLEDVIVRKLEFFHEGDSAKHVRDIRNMIRISASIIDTDILDREVASRGLHGERALAGKTHAS